MCGLKFLFILCRSCVSKDWKSIIRLSLVIAVGWLNGMVSILSASCVVPAGSFARPEELKRGLIGLKIAATL